MTEATINLQPLDAETMLVPIVGTSPLIVHAWSEKARRAMLDSQQGRKNVKTIRDPQADYEAAFYRIAPGAAESEYGFPVIAFKAATIGAARFFGKAVTMTALRQCVFMRGVRTDACDQQLVPIVGEPKMREDAVTVGMGGHDLRYRPEFTEWSATLRVTYVQSMLSRDSVLSLIDGGGMGIGVGEWRPEKRGENGTFAIDVERGVEVV
jgi:hypothetical protein